MDTPPGTLAVTLFGAVVASLLLIYILWLLITKFVQQRRGKLLDGSKRPVPGTMQVKLNSNELPDNVNGRRCTLSFWIYIYDIERFHGVYRNVFYRGTNTDSISANTGNPSPAITLDKGSNRMFITFGTNAVQGAATAVSQEEYDVEQTTVMYNNEQVTSNEDNAMYIATARRGIIADYIPTNRWVHVAVVLNEEVNGGVIQLYLDGELVKMRTRTSKSEVVIGAEEVPFDVRDINMDIKGDVYVGGNPTGAPSSVGFSGLVSRISMYNYDLNTKDIHDLYLQGPLDSVMAKLGLAAYGVRSPLYRIG